MNQFLLTLLMFPLTSLAAQTVQRDLGNYTDWKAAQIQGHDLWKNEACIASTTAKSDLSTLEIYASKMDDQSGYAEPTVQVVTRGAPAYVRGVLVNESNGTKVYMVLASNQDNPAQTGLMTRLDDRASLVLLLKRSTQISLQLIDARNKVAKTLRFSLMGSTKAIDAAYSGCGINL